LKLKMAGAGGFMRGFGAVQESSDVGEGGGIGGNSGGGGKSYGSNWQMPQGTNATGTAATTGTTTVGIKSSTMAMPAWLQQSKDALVETEQWKNVVENLHQSVTTKLAATKKKFSELNPEEQQALVETSWESMSGEACRLDLMSVLGNVIDTEIAREIRHAYTTGGEGTETDPGMKGNVKVPSSPRSPRHLNNGNDDGNGASGEAHGSISTKKQKGKPRKGQAELLMEITTSAIMALLEQLPPSHRTLTRLMLSQPFPDALRLRAYKLHLKNPSARSEFQNEMKRSRIDTISPIDAKIVSESEKFLTRVGQQWAGSGGRRVGYMSRVLSYWHTRLMKRGAGRRGEVSGRYYWLLAPLLYVCTGGADDSTSIANTPEKEAYLHADLVENWEALCNIDMGGAEGLSSGEEWGERRSTLLTNDVSENEDSVPEWATLLWSTLKKGDGALLEHLINIIYWGGSGHTTNTNTNTNTNANTNTNTNTNGDTTSGGANSLTTTASGTGLAKTSKSPAKQRKRLGMTEEARILAVAFGPSIARGLVDLLSVNTLLFVFDQAILSKFTLIIPRACGALLCSIKELLIEVVDFAELMECVENVAKTVTVRNLQIAMDVQAFPETRKDMNISEKSFDWKEGNGGGAGSGKSAGGRSFALDSVLKRMDIIEMATNGELPNFASNYVSRKAARRGEGEVRMGGDNEKERIATDETTLEESKSSEGKISALAEDGGRGREKGESKGEQENIADDAKSIATIPVGCSPWSPLERVTAFYKKYNPSKIDTVPKIVKKYDTPAKIDKLFVKLCEQYGAEDEDPNVAYRGAMEQVYKRIYTREEIIALGPIESRSFMEKINDFNDAFAALRDSKSNQKKE